MITDIIITVGLIGVVVISIYAEIHKMKLEKAIENSKEFLDEYQDLVIKGDIKSDKIYFYPDKKAFNNKTKSERKLILLISTFCLILFVISFPFGLWKNLRYGIDNIIAKIGLISFACSIIGFIYYAGRYYDKGENIINDGLYFDNKRDTLFFDIDKSSLYATSRHRHKMINRMLNKVSFGLQYINHVIYSIKSISYISVDKDNITFFGNVVRTSFDKYIKSDAYLEYIQLNEKVTFYEDNEKIQMFSKEVKSVKIPRGYGGFEKFLISKQYSGSENL